MSGNQQKMSVQWNNHLQSLGTAFPRMFTTQKFVDVTLSCEGRRIHCHRVVLAACSYYFEEILDENPAQHPIIILPRDVKYWAIQALVQYMYKGEVSVIEGSFGEFMKCAELLQVHSLNKTAADHLFSADDLSFNRDEDHLNYELKPEEYSAEAFQHLSKPQKSSTKAKPPKTQSIKQRRMTVAAGAFHGSTPSPSMESTHSLNQTTTATTHDSQKYSSHPSSASESDSMDSNDSYTKKRTPFPVNPPKYFVFNSSSKTGRLYTRKTMWTAMMSVKAGVSISRAAKMHKIPYKTLYVYVKNYGIKSVFKSNKTKNRSQQKNLENNQKSIKTEIM